MFARFNVNPAMTLQDIKEPKRYGRTHERRENSIPTTNKVCGGDNENFGRNESELQASVKREYQKIIFLISQPKHMLSVLKRTVSMRQFF